MKNSTVALNHTSLSSNNYTAIQMILPLDLEKEMESSNPVYPFLDVMEGVNWNKYLLYTTHKGRHEYHPFKMMKVILFAFVNKIYSLRDIEKACKTDIRFMYLIQEETTSHMTFQRFIQNYIKEHISTIFKDIFESIEAFDQSIDHDTIYIDGTKLEANDVYPVFWTR